MVASRTGGWGQRYNDEVMGLEMARARATPGDMLFGRRTWLDFITAWGRSTDGKPPTTPAVEQGPPAARGG